MRQAAGLAGVGARSAADVEQAVGAEADVGEPVVVGADAPRIARAEPRLRRDRIALGIEGARAVDRAFVEHERLRLDALVDGDPQAALGVAHEAEGLQRARLLRREILRPDDLLQVAARRIEAPHAAGLAEDVELAALAVAREAHAEIRQANQFTQLKAGGRRGQRAKIRRGFQRLERLEIRRGPHGRDVVRDHAAAGVAP